MLRRNIEAISPTRNSEQYQTYKYTAWAGLKKQKQKNNNKTTKERVEGLTLWTPSKYLWILIWENKLGIMCVTASIYLSTRHWSDTL